MQLTDLLPGIGRTVAYYPALARALGSVNAALLLCQLIYWFGKEADPELGIYKTKAELTEETGLSRREQDAATAKLVQLGLLTMHYQRLDHRMYYLLQIHALTDFWDNCQSSPKHENAFPEARKRLSFLISTGNYARDYQRRAHTRNGAGECGTRRGVRWFGRVVAARGALGARRRSVGLGERLPLPAPERAALCGARWYLAPSSSTGVGRGKIPSCPTNKVT
jgi:hypothetical protein